MPRARGEAGGLARIRLVRSAFAWRLGRVSTFTGVVSGCRLYAVCVTWIRLIGPRRTGDFIRRAVITVMARAVCNAYLCYNGSFPVYGACVFSGIVPVFSKLADAWEMGSRMTRELLNCGGAYICVMSWRCIHTRWLPAVRLVCACGTRDLTGLPR